MSILKGPWSPGPWGWKSDQYGTDRTLYSASGEKVLLGGTVWPPIDIEGSEADEAILELALPAIEALARVVYDHGGGDCDDDCHPDCAWRLARSVLARVPGGWDALHAQLEAYVEGRELGQMETEAGQ